MSALGEITVVPHARNQQTADFLPGRQHLVITPGITVYLNNDGDLERAQKQAGHADSRTTKLYHREDAELELADILKIQI